MIRRRGTRQQRRSTLSADRGRRQSNGPLAFATFIVRIARDDTGRIRGVVERVRTGQTVQFRERAAISDVIAHMVERRDVGLKGKGITIGKQGPVGRDGGGAVRLLRDRRTGHQQSSIERRDGSADGPTRRVEPSMCEIRGRVVLRGSRCPHALVTAYDANSSTLSSTHATGSDAPKKVRTAGNKPTGRRWCEACRGGNQWVRRPTPWRSRTSCTARGGGSS